jgi:hypothetical protein
MDGTTIAGSTSTPIHITPRSGWTSLAGGGPAAAEAWQKALPFRIGHPTAAARLSPRRPAPEVVR